MSAPAQELRGPLGSERFPHAHEAKLRDRRPRRSLPQACGSSRLSAGTQGRGTPVPATYADHRAQLKAILLAWGMPEENAETTADILSWADLHGVDSHGMSMIPGYDRLRRNGRAQHAGAAADREGDAGLGAGRRRWRAGARAGAFRDAGGDRQGQGDRHGDRRGAQLGAFRRHRLLHADGGEGGADRHGLHAALRRSRWRRPSARRRSSAPIPGRSPRRAPTGSRSCSTWRRRPSPPAASATRPTKDCTARRRLGAWTGRPAEHRPAGGAREGRVPDLARRLAGEFELQGLRPGGDGQHPRRPACRARR